MSLFPFSQRVRQNKWVVAVGSGFGAVGWHWRGTWGTWDTIVSECLRFHSEGAPWVLEYLGDLSQQLGLIPVGDSSRDCMAHRRHWSTPLPQWYWMTCWTSWRAGHICGHPCHLSSIPPDGACLCGRSQGFSEQRRLEEEGCQAHCSQLPILGSI